jgi:hypothetical protein
MPEDIVEILVQYAETPRSGGFDNILVDAANEIKHLRSRIIALESELVVQKEMFKGR